MISVFEPFKNEIFDYIHLVNHQKIHDEK